MHTISSENLPNRSHQEDEEEEKDHPKSLANNADSNKLNLDFIEQDISEQSKKQKRIQGPIRVEDS